MLRSRINVALNRRAALPSPSRALLSQSVAAWPRLYSSPSTPRSKPAAALATQASSAFEPGVMYTSTPKPEPEPHRFGDYPLRLHQPLNLPSPLPADVTVDPTSLASELYRSTQTIDTVSILAICATRPEFVPRAFLIFSQLLDNAKEGTARIPETKVWATVIKAMAKLGDTRDNSLQTERAALLWRHRAEKIVQEWETLQDQDSAGRAVKGFNPALKRQGILVYRAWFAGIVESGAPLDPMLPYIEHPELGVESLVHGLPIELATRALTQLETMATALGRQDILHQVDDIRSKEKLKLAFEERERKVQEVPEVKPLMEAVKAKTTSDVQDHLTKDLVQARFAIQNLRMNLKGLNTPLSAFNRQMALEKASYEAAEEELAHAAKQLEEAGVEDNSRLRRDGLQAHMHRWHQDLTERLEEDLKRMTRDLDSVDAVDPTPPKWGAAVPLRNSTLLLYLSVLPPKKLALITILEIMRLVGSGGITDGMKTLRGCVGVGKAVESEHRAETIRNVAGPGSAVWQRTLDSRTNKPDRSHVDKVWAEIGREREMRLAEREMELADAPAGSKTQPSTPGFDPTEDLGTVWTPPWTQMVQMSVGSYLVDALIQVSKITRYGKDHRGQTVSEEQNAFSHGYEYHRGKKLGVIRLNPAVADRLANDAIRPVIHPKHLPMLVPPRPWNKWNDGAYLSTPVQVMRFKDSIEQINYLREASNRGHLSPLFHGLDVLSSTPWTINRKVFDVVLECWNKGEAIADIPAAPDRVTYDYPEKLDPRINDPAARAVWYDRQKAAALQQAKDHGERCKYNYNLEIARSYLNDVFYIPHNVDFRGRAYPIPPHLSPVGDDLCRGLLTFGISKPLGPTGLKWLQIHLANVSGFDKASFEERAQFALDHQADVFDSADNPLTGKRWWLQSDDPFQCLAACNELAAAWRSPDPTKFESSLPIHQDGTCNGMQHYAALGGDVRGAKAVNLEKGDRPADIYTGVADLVNAQIAKDKAEGHPIAAKINLPLGRKVVKQTVMTTVYGVTFIGAREQIAKQLAARGDMSSEDVYSASVYVAHQVLGSIGDLFSGARAIQEWLTFSARLIARSIPADRIEDATKANDSTGTRKNAKKAKNSRLPMELMTSVVWTSPLGLPVVQPYRKDVKKQVMTALQTVYISDPNLPTQVAPQKQATAFPPNYIHSLDATHMLMTATRCNQNNITFASVHDSYWTHASTVESMSETIRDTFIHLHSQDLVGELREEFLQRYGDNYVPINNATYLVNRLKDRARETKAKQKALDSAEAESQGASATETSALTEDVDIESSSSNEVIKEGEEGVDISEVGNDVPIHQFGNHRFVRFRDLLPKTPPRGKFDVSRIRESEYFFS